MEHETDDQGTLLVLVGELLHAQKLEHNVDVGGTSHQTDPNEEWDHEVDRRDPEIVRVQEQEGRVKSLKDGQHVDSINLQVLETSLGDSDSQLVAELHEQEELPLTEWQVLDGFTFLYPVGVFCLGFSDDSEFHAISETVGITVFKEVNCHQPDHNME